MRIRTLSLSVVTVILGIAPNLFGQQGWQRAAATMPSAQTADAVPEAPAADQAADPRDHPELTLAAGTWITVRVDQTLSSDSNQSGDVFTASLAKPLVASGLVVASRGQTIGGVVTETTKAGRIKGTSRLGIELNELSLVDGRQIPIRTTLIQYAGDGTKVVDATAVATTSGVGAMIGAVADGGFGAGMGAIAGAGAGLIGVLATRGRATEIYPESLITFRLEEEVHVSTADAGYAFRPVTTGDYELRGATQSPQLARGRDRRPYPPYFYSDWYYGGWGYPGFYGPRIFVGPSLYGFGGYGYGRGSGRHRGRR